MVHWPTAHQRLAITKSFCFTKLHLTTSLKYGMAEWKVMSEICFSQICHEWFSLVTHILTLLVILINVLRSSFLFFSIVLKNGEGGNLTLSLKIVYWKSKRGESKRLLFVKKNLLCKFNAYYSRLRRRLLSVNLREGKKRFQDFCVSGLITLHLYYSFFSRYLATFPHKLAHCDHARHPHSTHQYNKNSANIS